MPRPKKVGGPEPKKRSRNGCWPCKARKVKCGEEKPNCLNCQRQGEACDYSIRLNWEGRTKKKTDSNGSQIMSFGDGNDSDTPGERGSMTPSEDLAGFNSPDLLGGQPFPQDPSPPLSYNDPYRTQIPPSSVPRLPYATSDPSGNWYGSSPAMNLGQNGGDPRLRGQSMGQYDVSSGMAPTSQFRNLPYPSPAESGLGSPGVGQIAPVFSSQMLPPYQSLNQVPKPPGLPGWDQGIEHRAKRLRMSPRMDSANLLPRNRFVRSSSYGPGDLDDRPRTFQPLTPTFPSAHFSNPLTPGASSTMSDDSHQRWMNKQAPAIIQDSSDVRRVSVNSLLSEPTEEEEREAQNFIPPPPSLSYNGSPFHTRSDSNATDTYGLDRGHPDLDLPKNNDAHAISSISPSESSFDIDSPGFDEIDFQEFGFGVPKKETVFAKGGYYAQPVPIKIPRSLEPLPSTLLQNPMNLLYFHHFLNHTARILVPHDCSNNPFKTILPQMAVENSNLLNLLLAYSASHRARLLNQPEPANRIAIWVRDVFPSLRHALESSSEKLSNANLATAIMLASLEIISPNTFEVAVPWQHHLNTARRIILNRGGVQYLTRKDKVSYFLSRWFAYLDILGSLSSRKNEQPLFSSAGYWATSNTSNSSLADSPSASSTSTGALDEVENSDDFQIDCLLGFTSRCVAILAQIASLARHCDNERITPEGELVENWAPSTHIASKAETLRIALNDARTHVYRGCPHRDANPDNPQDGWDSLEMAATNQAYHWAGQVHLYRRVLGKRRDDLEVQNAVREIVGALYKVRRGGQAEACLLFPMFTAGCDALDPGQREMILERVASIEGFGMTQVHKAKCLMQKVWETGKPWETLVQNEFFG